MTTISTYTNNDFAEIHEFLSNTQASCIFQTPDYFHAMKAAGNCRPYFFVARRDGKVCGCLLCNLMTRQFDKLGLFTGILDIAGVPVTDSNDEETLYLLLDAAKKIHPRPLYIQIAPVYDPEPIKAEILEYGFQFRPHLALKIDLSKSDKELFAAIGAHKARYIKKAQKIGLRLRLIETEEEINSCIQIVRQTYKRLHLPEPNINLFRTMAKTSDKLKVFGVCSPKNKIIACKSALCYKDTAYLYVSGSLDEYHYLHPNEFAYHEISLWAKHNGYSVLDMGGGGNPERPYGVRDFKMGFGPKAFNYGHYVLPLRPALMKLARKAYLLIYRR